MIKCTVKRLWHDQAGVNEVRYVQKAVLAGEGLQITLEETGEIMTIPHDQLERAQVARSQHPFRDKYGGPDYYLVYYTWVPTARQEAML